jgi:hypothetical protein
MNSSMNGLGTDKTSSLNDSASKITDASKRFGAEAREKISDLSGNFGEYAGDFYRTASQWLQGSNGRIVGMVGIVCAAGLIGYFLGCRSGAASMDLTSEGSEV